MVFFLVDQQVATTFWVMVLVIKSLLLLTIHENLLEKRVPTITEVLVLLHHSPNFTKFCFLFVIMVVCFVVVVVVVVVVVATKMKI